MKKFAMILVALVMTVTASAQFEKGTKYAGASLNGINLSYNSSQKFAYDIDLKGGYCLDDNLMVTAQFGIDHVSPITDISFGIGGRYYIIQNGIYLGVNAAVKQSDTYRYNDFVPGIEVGYAFFINRHVTIEPALYYDHSFKSNSDYSTIGLRIGLGIYM